MIKVAIQGLGPIGRETTKLILDDPELELVGAIDIKKEIIGVDVGMLLGKGRIGVHISSDPEVVFTQTKPDVLVLTTCSDLTSLFPSLMNAIKHKINIVSAAEELFYPEFVDKKMADFIDDAAKNAGVAIIGNGVNPGCLMDAFPLYVFKRARLDDFSIINVFRWDNSIERRLPLLKKTGAGLTKNEFIEKKFQKGFGHSGLELSANYIANHVGLSNYRTEFSREPVIAEEAVQPLNGDMIEKGDVLGLHEQCVVSVAGKPTIVLDLRMYVGVKNTNKVEIIGNKDSKIVKVYSDYSNIVNGDIATTLILKQAIFEVVKSAPGLNRAGFIPKPNELLSK